MSEQDKSGPRWLWKAAGLFLLALALVGGYRVCRLAFTPGSGPVHTTGVIAPYTMRLEDGDYTSMSPDGKKSWHVHAKRIDFDRAPGNPLTNIDRIEITGLTDGTLYKEQTDKPSATFRAGHGEYIMGQYAPQVANLLPTDEIQWEFRLSDNVKVHTATGDTLQAPSILIVGIRNRFKADLRQVLLCEEGATVKHRDISAHAVTARYDLQSRVVECIQGVSITLPKGSVLADRMFWMPDQHQIHIPENASGRLRDMSFNASNVSIDTLTNRYRGSHAQLQFHDASGAGVSLP